MKSNIHYSIIILITLIGITFDGIAQRKRKPDGETTSASVKLREAEFYFTEGEKFFILEDYAKALAYYTKALELNPENATIHYKIAEVLASGNKQDDLIKASISIERALTLEKKNKYFYLLAANIYNALSRFDKSATTYETMIREVKGTEEYLYELAVVYIYGQQLQNAIKTYDRAEQFFGVNEVASLQKQQLYFDLEKPDLALAEGEKLLNAFPDEERYVVGFAEVLNQQNQSARAITILEKFISENEIAPNACMLLAGLYRDNDQEDKARELIHKIFDDPEVNLNSKLIVLSTYSQELSQSREKNLSDPQKQIFVIELFEKLVREYPSESNVHILGGDLYMLSGKNDDALREYQLAVESGEANFEVWQNILYIETQLSRYDDVIQHAEKALEYYPNQAMLYYFNGFAHLRKKLYRESVQLFEQGKKISFSNPALVNEINVMLGEAYNGLKEYEKSDKAFEEALAFNSSNEIVLNNYSYYLALRKANLEKAEKMSALLIKNHPDNATYLDTHAWVLYVRAKYKEAKKVIERAIGTGKATSLHFEHYGDILFKLGETDHAVAQWEKARSLNGNTELLNKKIANRKLYE